MKTTLNAIREHLPCHEGWEKLLRHLGKTKSDDESGSLFSKAKALRIFDADKIIPTTVIKLLTDSSDADGSSDASNLRKPNRKRLAKGGGAKTKKLKTQSRTVDIESVSEIDEDSEFEL